MRLADGSIEGRKGSNGVPMHTVPRTAKMRPTYLFRAQTRLESDHHVHRVWGKREGEKEGEGKGKYRTCLEASRIHWSGRLLLSKDLQCQQWDRSENG